MRPLKICSCNALKKYRAETDREIAAKGFLPSVVYENGWKLTDRPVTQDEIDVIIDLIKEAAALIRNRFRFM